MQIKLDTDAIAKAVTDHIEEGFKDGWYEDNIADFIQFGLRLTLQARDCLIG